MYLTETQEQVREMTRAFADGVIRPAAEALDRDERFPVEIYEEMARLGLFGIGVPEAMGGPGSNLRAWLGPSIGPAYFEVGAEVREAFLAAGDSARAFTPNPRGRWQCDLPALARARLQRLGVTRIAGGEWCTAADPVRFFSHRRDQRTGRMAALLWRC